MPTLKRGRVIFNGAHMRFFRRKKIQTITTQTPKTFSRDLWDYLGEMPLMPSRQDRDELVLMGNADPNQQKRAQIWDYFFRIDPNDLGKPQLRQIEEETQTRDKRIKAISAKRKDRIVFALAVIVFAGVVAAVAYYANMTTILYGAALFFALGILGLLWFLIKSNQDIAKARQQYQQDFTTLTKQIEGLRKKMPVFPTTDQMDKWLAEDLEMLAQRAIEKIGLTKPFPKLADGAPNPVCIAGPAFLQRPKALPETFFDPVKPDQSKHFAAYHFDFMNEGDFIDFYGVYYVEFFIVAEKMIGNYGCFYDFISGKSYKEHTAEMYYQDIVMLSTKHEYRRVDFPWIKFTWENAPTFSMSLTSGQTIAVTYPSTEYFAGTNLPNNQSGYRFDPARWVRNPEKIAETALKALRAQLKIYKVI